MQTEQTPPAKEPAANAPATEQPTVNVTAPGQIRVIKRNGTVVQYNNEKISIAITRAFLAVEGGAAAASARIRETVTKLTDQVSATFSRRMPSGGTIHIEDIQDQVELALMRSGEHKIAQSYVLYRAEHARQRAEDNIDDINAEGPAINIVLENGETQKLDIKRFKRVVKEACADLDYVNSKTIVEQALKNLYDGVSIDDLSTSLVMTARTMIEEEPNYTYVTARLLLDSLRREALSFLDVADSATHTDMSTLYAKALPAYIEKGIELELIAPQLREFDLERLGAALKPECDLQFTYLGLQTLYDRYFIHWRETRFELPQIFFMRVAMGLSVQEDDKNARAIEFYELLSSFDYMSSTPTLFNAGTLRPQLSSCYLTTVPDDLHGIYGAMQDNAMLSKWAGGLGNDWTPVRALGAHIKGTNGKSQGIVPFLKVVNDTAVAVNQGGKRKGAVCAYLESWHLDIEEFLDLRKNTGDDRRRTHDMNTANWIPDLFMKRVFEEKEWTLFSPNDVPDLHDLYGKAFEDRYEEYEIMAANGEIKLFKKIPAQDLWRKMLGMLFETGHPWITFKDVCNLRSPQQHVGVVHSSNLCTEITLNTSADEIAVCNLGSVNLAQHVEDGALNADKLKKTVTTAIRMLDNVIDINYYAVPQAKTSNMRHRPIGLGLMGFQDALYKMALSYGSDAAVQFADESMEMISYHAISASSDLAAERGAYETYDGSLWSQGVLPIDSIQLLIENRGKKFIDQDTSEKLDWAPVREKVAKVGMRNSNVMAIAPTATIANITGVSQSIEPTYQNLYVKSNLSGEFTVVNPYLVRDLKDQGLWDNVMIHDLKYFEGSVQSIDRIPEEIKARYATAFELEPRWIVDAASRRQKWLDQAQSLNLYINGANGKKLDITYRMAWFRGLKTTYYLRALAATSTEKSTVNTSSLNAVSAAPTTQAATQAEEAAGPAPVPQACSLDDPDCEACQ
ncbi:Ribonucleoside-diphosphate reductase 1 subunit alpha [BD1-7 clade bacterium]|uniref:Ribonucleoside-diphosphate reductase n=1 Tax=BD1-7 clade bacterium TaxID=2029982 RepID=A0A5S9P3L9_9GAMM|nr:Ribonucleoside-diphosphate reductase 1 subunit alpha [BD1-7 clade bacterium]